MKAIKLFSKALLSHQTLLLITTTFLLNNLIAYGQYEDLSKRIKIQELTIDDLKRDNRNCVIMNQVLGDEIKQSKDSVSNLHLKLSEANKTLLGVNESYNKSVSKSNRFKTFFIICLVIIAGLVFIIFKLLANK